MDRRAARLFVDAMRTRRAGMKRYSCVERLASLTRSSSARFRTRRSCRYGRERWCGERRAPAVGAGVAARPRRASRVGCDLAQANDWTAVSVIEHKVGVLDYNTEWERHCVSGARPQVKAEYFDLRHLERVRGLSYVDTG